MSRLRPQIHPLLTEEIVDALHTKQVHTVLDFIKADTQQIIKAARLNFREVLAVRKFLLKKFSAAPTNGFDCYKTTLNNTAIISTGIKGVDHLLCGGLFTGYIYEICGLPAAGKTQFVASLMKNEVQNTQQKVYLFDTKNDFSAAKMKNMLKVRWEKGLSKILVNRTHTKYDLINGLYELKTNLEKNLKLRLIIIDSLPSVILNSNDVVNNNVYLNHLVNIIRYIATEHHIAFVVTNLVTTWNGISDFKSQQETLENIACGRYWFGVPNTRLKIEKLENKGMCRVSIMNSDSLVNKGVNSVDIRITEEGFL